jgi:anti-sigma regulatory factor (Ser/Thr protein kinase)
MVREAGHVGRDNLAASAAYQPEPTAAAAARRFVRDTLHGWVGAGASTDGKGLVDDAVLLTSELVTNAVVHAGTPVQVTCRLADGAVEVVVSDNHPARLVPEPAENDHPPAERTSGRGLLLPAALASAWGVTYGRVSKSVWFRLGPAAYAAEDGSGGGARSGRRLEGDAHAGSVLAAALRSPGVLNDYGGEASEGYAKLLTSTLEAAAQAVGADAALALMPDEDGDLRLRASAGDLPLAAGVTNAATPLPGEAWLAAAQADALAAPSLATVPFVVDGQVTGLLAAASATPGKFGEAEAASLQRLADRWGPPLQRAWLASLEQVRRGRMAALADARRLLATGLTEGEIMELAGHATVPRIAEWCAVLLGDSDAGLRVAYVCHAEATRTQELGQLLGRACQRAMPPGLWAGASPGPWRRWSLAEASNAAAGETVVEGSVPAPGDLSAGTAWCFPLGSRRERPGVFVIGAGRDGRLPQEAGEAAADIACRIQIALASARLMPSGKDEAHAAL